MSQTSTFFGFWPLVGILAAMLIAGYLVGAKTKKMVSPMRQVASRMVHTFILIGWLGLLYMFFRYEGAAYLAWRIWPTILFIYLLWQVWMVIRYLKWEYPKKLAARELTGDKEVYLRRYQKKRK